MTNCDYIEIVELPSFVKSAKACFSEGEVLDLVGYLSVQPNIGDIIKGTGGLRKVRYSAKGKGKKGGARVIYYYHNNNHPLLLIYAYSKNEAEDITEKQRQIFKFIVDEIKNSWGSK